MTSFYGSSCANNSKGALNTPGILNGLYNTHLVGVDHLEVGAHTHHLLLGVRLRMLRRGGGRLLLAPLAPLGPPFRRLGLPRLFVRGPHLGDDGAEGERLVAQRKHVRLQPQRVQRRHNLRFSPRTKQTRSARQGVTDNSGAHLVLLEDGGEVLGVDARNATLAGDLVRDAARVIRRVAVLHVDAEHLHVRAGVLRQKRHRNLERLARLHHAAGRVDDEVAQLHPFELRLPFVLFVLARRLRGLLFLVLGLRVRPLRPLLLALKLVLLPVRRDGHLEGELAAVDEVEEPRRGGGVVHERAKVEPAGGRDVVLGEARAHVHRDVRGRLLLAVERLDDREADRGVALQGHLLPESLLLVEVDLNLLVLERLDGALLRGDGKQLPHRRRLHLEVEPDLILARVGDGHRLQLVLQNAHESEVHAGALPGELDVHLDLVRLRGNRQIDGLDHAERLVHVLDLEPDQHVVHRLLHPGEGDLHELVAARLQHAAGLRDGKLLGQLLDAGQLPLHRQQAHVGHRERQALLVVHQQPRELQRLLVQLHLRGAAHRGEREVHRVRVVLDGADEHVLRLALVGVRLVRDGHRVHRQVLGLVHLQLHLRRDRAEDGRLEGGRVGGLPLLVENRHAPKPEVHVGVEHAVVRDAEPLHVLLVLLL
eukprot:1181738-Prorocentrum_minimum.AAC.1